ncbi:SDR family oxidoreductase [Nocardiopsis sp. HNM0947]|uniref:SDR family oxidoreductase n=1 Tax=Nocardiopsis coralli TaxID=2772213 RepID=A0ABR9P402_9ACTN|nr:SDR family oxidoreductase [Nocardiopsis coralli]MBE2998566.1 SDR family oxidoreductase [Nocardiopsis coralli]
MPQNVLVTGASSGIGRATAELFHAKGWNVVATMRNPSAETELTGRERLLVTRLDVTDHASITSAVAEAEEHFGPVDVLVNNAGFAVLGPLESVPVQAIERQFATNVTGLLAVTKAVLPRFRTRRSGVVVNVSSLAGKVAFPLGSLYVASKHAVEGVSESLSFELRAIGARMKIIEPGGVESDFGHRSSEVNHDEELTEYGPLLEKVVAGLKAGTGAEGAPASGVARAVFDAATDGTDRLRYVVGEDAEQAIAHRAGADDAEYLAQVNAQFGL